ncbi:MAG: hypothetical protein ABSA52_20265 [Candidatus Binatia bacterium]|jgi:hypothetical protein
MSDLIHFTMSQQKDRKGDEVRAILEAHLAYEHTRTARQFLVHVLAAVGGLLALSMVFPQIASEELRKALLVLWGVCCMWAIGAAVSERVYRRREAQLLAANEVDARGLNRAVTSP